MKKFLLILLLLLAMGWLTAGPCALAPLSEAQAAAFLYHGNRKSHIFHRPGCRYYDCRNCVVAFASREEALAAGFRPCKVCRP